MKRGGRLLLLLLTASLSMAEQDKSELKKTKDSLNRALDQMAGALHSAGSGAKRGGNSLLQKLDDSIHRFWNSLKGSTSKKSEGGR